MANNFSLLRGFILSMHTSHNLSHVMKILTLQRNHLMGIFRQIAEYLYIKKPDPNSPRSQWMKYMHGINRISIFLFLMGIIFILIRILFFRK
jgi:hypothetical protein